MSTLPRSSLKSSGLLSVAVGVNCVFFSSRRRHTRFDCDWSSDVCSSDLRLLGEDDPEGAVVVADEQTEGRGRLGRQWHAPAGTSLLFSILLRPDVEAARLPRSEEHTSELQSQSNLVCRLLLEKKKITHALDLVYKSLRLTLDQAFRWNATPLAHTFLDIFVEEFVLPRTLSSTNFCAFACIVR